MTAISFYHLSVTPLEKALPRLLEKVVSQDLRVVWWLPNDDTLKTMDTVLWSYSTRTFLAHGTCHDKFKDEQPIYLTTELENPNHATVLVLTHPFTLEDSQGWERVVDMFDGSEPEELKAARARWKHYQAAGHVLTYWQQANDGTWQKGG